MSGRGAGPAPDGGRGAEPVSMRDAYRELLVELATADRSIICLDSDTGGLESTFGARLPGQYVNLGIAEQNLMSVAAGLARGGKRVFVNALAAFASMRAAEQLKVDVAAGNLPVTVVATHAGFSAGHLGPTHWALEDLAVTRVLPNLTVLVPADVTEARGALVAAATHPGPIYLRLGRHATPPVYDRPRPFRIGPAVRLRDGDDVTIVSTGARPAGIAMAAHAVLRSEGIRAGVLNVHTVKPLDREAVLDAAARSGGIVTVEEHSRHGGLGGAVAEVVSEHRPCRVTRIGAPDGGVPFVGSPDELLARAGIGVEQVVAAARSLYAVR